MKKSGVYQIVNTVNGKIYVGSGVCFKIRWGQHKSDLKNNKHDNSYLQNSWNKHGKDNFEFIILEVVKDKEKLIEREQHWLDKTKCCKRKIGYNIYSIAGSSLGMRHSEEHKKKMSDAQKKRYENGCKSPMLGRSHSEETKQKMSDTTKKQYEDGFKHPMLGKNHSEETKKNMSLAKSGENNSFYGKNHSKEAKQKISEAGKGRKCTGKTKKKLSNATSGKNNPFYGKNHTEESRLKIGRASKGRNIGEKNDNSKLNNKQVRIIKWLLKNSDMLQREIGEIFSIKQTTVSSIKAEKTWKHIK